jgi:hypothetical protein
MKLVDSKQKQLDYGEIMHIYHSNEKQDDKRLEDFKVWMAAMAATIATIKAEGEIIGNTFFLYRRGPAGKEHTAMVWAMNADSLQNMVDNVAEGLTRLVSMGVTDVLASYTHVGITRVMRQAFKKISNEGDDLAFHKANDGTIFMRMKLSGGEDV